MARRVAVWEGMQSVGPTSVVPRAPTPSDDRIRCGSEYLIYFSLAEALVNWARTGCDNVYLNGTIQIKGIIAIKASFERRSADAGICE
jgi:hypothetical protein